jgi:hypothetical protein
MKNSTQLRLLAGVAAGLALSPLAAHAQVSPAATAGETTTSSPVDTTGYRGERHEHHNYGWIGLLGLLGLTGLMRRGPERREVYGTTTARSTDVGDTDVRR